MSHSFRLEQAILRLTGGILGSRWPFAYPLQLKGSSQSEYPSDSTASDRVGILRSVLSTSPS